MDMNPMPMDAMACFSDSTKSNNCVDNKAIEKKKVNYIAYTSTQRSLNHVTILKIMSSILSRDISYIWVNLPK